MRAFLEKYTNASFRKINHLVVTTKESYYSFHGADLLFDSIWPKIVKLHSWIFQFMEALSTQGGYHLSLHKEFLHHGLSIGEDKEEILYKGPRFWGHTGLFMRPWH